MNLSAVKKWNWNGPEEGDAIDASVIIMFDNEERIELTTGALRSRKAAARKITALLNQLEAEAL